MSVVGLARVGRITSPFPMERGRVRDAVCGSFVCEIQLLASILSPFKGRGGTTPVELKLMHTQQTQLASEALD